MTDLDNAVRWLLEGSDYLLTGLDHASDDASRLLAAQLRASVGPLRQAASMQAAHAAENHDDNEAARLGARRTRRSRLCCAVG